MPAKHPNNTSQERNLKGGGYSGCFAKMRQIQPVKIMRALAGALVVVLLVTFMVFMLSYLSPTDAASHSFSAMGVVPTEAQLAAKRAELGLDQPLLAQFTTWLAKVLQGDLGVSYRSGAEVTAILFAALPYTFLLAFAALILTLFIAVPLGLICAYWRDGILDHFLRVVTYVFNAMPAFFIALLFLYVFSVRLQLIGVLATRGAAGMLLPVLALALPLSAWFMRQVRASAIEQMGAPYVEGLRARGINEWRIVCIHVLRNMAPQLLTLIGVALGMLLGGSAIVESIFHWPGVGFMCIEAVSARDYPIIGAYALFMALVYLVINALVDRAAVGIDSRLHADRARGA